MEKISEYRAHFFGFSVDGGVSSCFRFGGARLHRFGNSWVKLVRALVELVRKFFFVCADYQLNFFGGAADLSVAGARAIRVDAAMDYPQFFVDVSAV